MEQNSIKLWVKIACHSFWPFETVEEKTRDLMHHPVTCIPLGTGCGTDIAWFFGNKIQELRVAKFGIEIPASLTADKILPQRKRGGKPVT